MEQPVDRSAFDRLMLGALPALERFAIRLTGNPESADDLAQETVVRAARSWRTFRARSSFETWLFQIAINAFRDSLAASKRIDPMPTDLTDSRPAGPVAEASAAEIGEIVAQHVSSLPPRQREVLVLIVYEQLEISEVANVLQLSEQNVRTNLHLARQRLKLKLAPHLSNPINP